MKPVAIFRHSPGEGPGYFAIFLEQHGISWRLIPVDEGVAIPRSAEGFSGLCFMGGPMSVNDPLPWINEICLLIQDAVHRGIPVIGHCLGGQLMSKALGGLVTKNAVREVGWGSGTPKDCAVSKMWLGDFVGQEQTLFQWHGETFSLPEGATLLLSNVFCRHQAFVLGPHLGMQCHVEMTPEMISAWCEHWAAEFAGLTEQASIQPPEIIEAQIPTKLPLLRPLADQLYGCWIRNLRS